MSPTAYPAGCPHHEHNLSERLRILGVNAMTYGEATFQGDVLDIWVCLCASSEKGGVAASRIIFSGLAQIFWVATIDTHTHTHAWTARVRLRLPCRLRHAQAIDTHTQPNEWGRCTCQERMGHRSRFTCPSKPSVVRQRRHGSVAQDHPVRQTLAHYRPSTY